MLPETFFYAAEIETSNRSQKYSTPLQCYLARGISLRGVHCHKTFRYTEMHYLKRCIAVYYPKSKRGERVALIASKKSDLEAIIKDIKKHVPTTKMTDAPERCRNWFI